MASSSVSLSGKIEETKSNFTSRGFCSERDGEIVWVDIIRSSNERSLFKDYPKYDIALLSPISEDDERENPIIFSEEGVYVEKGDSILAIGYASEEEEVVDSEGVVLDVSESDPTFTIQTKDDFKPKFYSVFSVDKVNSAIHLAGVFSPKLGKVVHVEAFDEVTRGKEVQVQFRGFKGFEQGNPGRGPRSILITHPNLQHSYLLQFVVGERSHNPHYDGNYNKNQPELYQKALEAFVAIYQPGGEIPATFEFIAYKKSQYIATLMG